MVTKNVNDNHNDNKAETVEKVKVDVAKAIV